ncbi:MAG: site-2 protease family protein [Actinobacteria bacterium]|nr:site-2 protease family protein [Actinomycetota bacterium]
MSLPSLDQLLLIVPAFVLAITIHEASHALVATLLGEPLPKTQGRLTLNPLRHLDPFGSILLIIYGFGWGKPVYVDGRYFRGNPVRSMALVSLAGPLSNLLLAGLQAVGLRIAPQALLGAPELFLAIYTYTILVNIVLAVFNMIPLPPLDGFSILMGVLPTRLASKLGPLYRYGPVILLALFILPGLPGPLGIDLLGPVIGPAQRFLQHLFLGW